MQKIFLSIILFLASYESYAQDYVTYITGDTADVKTNADFGIVLAGGGQDNDEAMKWMLRKANNGDVLVLRASGSNGYNEYFKNELGVAINSVESIVFNTGKAAQDSYVLRRINEAEVIFIAGGDQAKYFDFWNGTEVESILQNSLATKSKIIGGTSAGMMILGNIIYAPTAEGVKSAEALANPYDKRMNNIFYNDFIALPIFQNTIFDTHFDNRSRNGRLITFMARAYRDKNIKTKAIACNESTAICIDKDNVASIFGIDTLENSNIYFLKYNCETEGQPQKIQPNKKLHWSPKNKNAIIVQKIPATKNGSNKFDLNNWKALDNVVFQHWHVSKGVLEMIPDDNADCKEK